MTFLSTPAFGILITIVAFAIGTWIRQKTRSDLANPLLIALVIIIVFIKVTPASYEQYRIGGDIIHFVLSPLTVALGLMLYRQRVTIKKYGLSLLIGITSGVLTSFFSILILGRWLGMSESLIVSVIPKSITTPMAISLANMIGGNPAISVVLVIITGITGALTAPYLKKLFPFLGHVSVGIAIGTASHAVGTSKAIEIGEKEGALSSAAIGLAGIITVLIVPFLVNLFL